ncbi:MAG: phosphate ABC transporter substrate-binding protein [Gammaproteobacteria bacterium]|nr:MAG: phosphate ABC transporter substrate-binding protein [Gammaproteobacteria bacterium]PCJ21988.1 MAG: phosphate ABC transporter substrate-binding protein [Gammaproteobacteria bacterium]
MRIKQTIKAGSGLIFAAFFIAFSSINFANASTVVIVSKDSPVTQLTQHQVRQIFLKQNKYFPGGSSAIPIDQTANRVIKKDFYQSVAHMTGAQWMSYWSKLVFTGKKNPPRLSADSTGVVKLVASGNHFIGYIDSESVDNQVKVVYALPN